MRQNKIAELFVTSLNDMLTAGQLGNLEDSLKPLNQLLGALAPGYTVLTMRDVAGQLVGFSPYLAHTTTHEPSTPAPPVFEGGDAE